MLLFLFLLIQPSLVQALPTDTSVLTGNIVSQTEDPLGLNIQIGQMSISTTDVEEEIETTLSGMPLKTLNTILTISSTNRLAEEMGLKPVHKPKHKSRYKKKPKVYFSLGASILSSGKKLLIAPTLRLGLAIKKERIILNGFIMEGTYTDKEQEYENGVLIKNYYEHHNMTTLDISLQDLIKTTNRFYLKMGIGMSTFVTSIESHHSYWVGSRNGEVSILRYKLHSYLSIISGYGWEIPLSKKGRCVGNIGFDIYHSLRLDEGSGSPFILHLIPHASLVLSLF